MPERIQLRRTKGWKKPEGAVVVARRPGGVFGNPFTVRGCRDAGIEGTDDHLRAVCVAEFRGWLGGDSSTAAWMGPESNAARAALLSRLPELRGRDLACWCPPGSPCHADVLLELANA